MSQLKNGPRRRNPEFDIRHIRKELLLYCSGLPDIIRSDVNGSELGDLALSIGNAFCWIEHTFEHYERQPRYMDDQYKPEESLGAIGKELQELGRKLFHKLGHESVFELQLAKLNLKVRSLEKMVLRIGGVAI